MNNDVGAYNEDDVRALGGEPYDPAIDEDGTEDLLGNEGALPAAGSHEP